MLQNKQLIKHRIINGTDVATGSYNVKKRGEINEVLNELDSCIPRKYIAGPPFCIFNFITSLEEGYDVTIGFPVSPEYKSDRINVNILPDMEVLSLLHRGPVNEIAESYKALYKHAYNHGLISDEFNIEIYPDYSSNGIKVVDICFVIHRWNNLLSKNLERVLGDESRKKVMQESNKLTAKSTVKERYNWTRKAIERIIELSNMSETYDIISGCAHIFPEKQIEKLKSIYNNTKSRTGNSLQAIDAVIKFMGDDPGWGQKPIRRGNTIFLTKKPRNPEGYRNAQNDLERKKAYCFCPIIRGNPEGNMPVEFCYCGAGWYRQQWEGAIGKALKIDIIKSLLKGDSICQFSIHLPEDL